MTPYYEDDACTIYHGDCLDIIDGLADPVDLWFTSPPYNMGTTTGGGMHGDSLAAKSLSGGYESYSDDMPQDEYDEWQKLAVRSMWAKTSGDGAIAYQHKPRVQAGRLILPTDYGPRDYLRQIITWDKEFGMNYSASFFLPTSEWIVLWAKPAWRLRDKSASQIGNVWRTPPETRGNHPAPFPIGLPTRMIDATTAALICDPFMGSGTTLRAAKDLGRKAIGIEMDEKYCEMAAKRLVQEVLDFGDAA